MLSKSSFLTYLQCPAYFWFNQNKPEVLTPTALTDFEQALADQGKFVEKEFYKLFPDAEFVVSKGQPSVDETISKVFNGPLYLAQAGFSSPDFFAQSDLVHFKGDNHVDIYEIKSSSGMQNAGLEETTQAPSKEEHMIDLAFQYEVAIRAGYLVDRLYLVELNKLYVRHGDLDLHALFNINDVTIEVHEQAPLVREQMQSSLSQLSNTEQPTTCNCKYLPRNRQCPAFTYLHPELAVYGVYDLSNIGRSPKRLREFVDNNIIRIEDIPPDHDLTSSCRDQVFTWNRNEEVILRDQIRSKFAPLEFPLYFLDYETTAPAIPLFDGIRPYQHIPFQYSLHILDQNGGEARHLEFLHDLSSNPTLSLSQRLRKDIGDTGTIIVWNKVFETKCNENLAECVPKLKDFLLGINALMFDLMKIFSEKLYVHKDFRGRCSIKKVLPVLVPDLSYDVLDINDGGKATTHWSRMVSDPISDEEKETIRQQLLDYCKLDTLAMVEVYRKILEKIQ